MAPDREFSKHGPSLASMAQACMSRCVSPFHVTMASNGLKGKLVTARR